jgi:hypothetical protein
MTTCVFCDVHSSQKKLQCLIICKEVKIYGVTAISCTEIETLSHELLVSEMSIQFIIIYINQYGNSFKGSSWLRSHGNQCQSPSGSSRLTSYGAWRGLPNTPVCVLYLVRMLVILCQ